MAILEEIKEKWNSKSHFEETEMYNLAVFRRMVRRRVKRHNEMSLQYFWKSLFLQALVYLMVGYVMVTNYTDTVTVISGIAAYILYIPFTIHLFKRAQGIVAGKKLDGNSKDSLHSYVRYSYVALRKFFKFKKRADLILTPLSCLIGIFLTFRLFMPGSIYEWSELAGITFIITLLSCFAAIRDENKKNFREPLQRLKNLLNEFDNNQ